MKWFANYLLENQRDSPLYRAALSNNTLKTKSFKEKASGAVSQLQNWEQSTEKLPKALDYLFYS